MADPVVKGRVTPIELPTSSEVQSDGSWHKTHGFEGLPSAIEAKFAEEVASENWETVGIERGRTVSRLTLGVESSGDSSSLQSGVIKEFWELDRNLVDLPLRMHPYFADAGYLDILDGILREGTTPVWGEDDLAGAGAKDKVYYYSKMAGQDSIPYSSYVVRRIKIVKSMTVAVAKHEGVNTVVALPGDRPHKLLGAIHTDVEWLYQPPDVREAGGRKYQISHEWWGGQPKWSIIYGGTWDPSAGK